MNEPLDMAADALGSGTLEATLSFESFSEAESRILFRRLWLVTGNRLEAEELTQDAFLKVCHESPRLARGSRKADDRSELQQKALGIGTGDAT
ncbi:MAG TPA: hypothetical protein VJ913_03510 [Actinomycetota bacterium]|nr:hypothetical protein [Actinomycetota bacterium]